jgi:vesicle transport protein SEC22
MSQACFLAVLVARATDKFPLCSFTDPSFQQTRGPVIAKSVTSEQMDRVLSRFKSSPGNQIQSFDFQEFTYYVLPDTTAIVVLCVNRHATPFTSFGAGHQADTKIQESACNLLENIQSEFTTMYRPELVASASKPYQFIRFDQQLQKLIRRSTQSLSSAASRGGGVAAVLQQNNFQQQQQQQVSQNGDGSGLHYRGGGAATSTNNNNNNQPQPPSQPHNISDPYAAIKKEVADVHNVMRQNLDDLMTRGEKLDTMSIYSTELRDSSKTYYDTTKNMNRMRLLKLYGPPAVIISFLLAYFWFFIL